MRLFLSILIIVIIITPSLSYSQDNSDKSGTISVNKPDSVAEEVFVAVENPPQFPGGSDAMNNFIRSNIQYPDSAIKYEVSGRVIVQFVIRKDGKISDTKIVKGVGGSYGRYLNEEAKRVVSLMPDWIPGSQKGQLVNATYLLPVVFNLK